MPPPPTGEDLGALRSAGGDEALGFAHSPQPLLADETQVRADCEAAPAGGAVAELHGDRRPDACHACAFGSDAKTPNANFACWRKPIRLPCWREKRRCKRPTWQ